METALRELTLVFFTTIAPAGVVGYLVMAAHAWLAPEGQAARTSRYLVIPLALVITGLIASATHLGTPENALYVITGVGRSPLSNEVATAVAFLALGGVYWIVSFRDDVPGWLHRAGLALSSVAGLVFVLFISLAYSVSTVPTWSLPTAPLTLWAGALASGPFVGMAGVLCAGAPMTRRLRAVCFAMAGAGTVVNAALLLAEWQALAGIATTVVSARELVPWFPFAIAAFAVLEAAAVISCAVAVRGLSGPIVQALDRVDVKRACLVVLAVVLSLAGCFAVRFAFYAMHMTIGM